MIDLELIQRYAEHADEEAFTELVHRHAGWVGLMAMRLTRENRAMADDVTQAVFILLARKAKSLKREVVLSGWLFAATRYCARSALRNEARLRRREREAAVMRNEIDEQPGNTEWNELSPLLDELVGGMRKVDQQILLLRFYRDMSFPQIGQELAMSEEAARKRAGRAIEQLRGLFAQRGIKIGSAALSAALAVNLSHTSVATAGTLASSALASSKTVALPSIAKNAAAMLTWAALKPAAVALLGLGLVSAAVTAVILQENATTKPTMAAASTSAPTTVPFDAAVPAFRYGRVVTQDDKPVAGATIFLQEFLADNSSWKIAAQTTSGASGRFQFPRKDDDEINFAVLAVGHGLTYGRIGDESTAEYPVDMQVPPSTTLNVHFVDPDGKPVPGLRVQIPSIPEELQKEFAQTTDGTGRCVFPEIAQRESARLSITDERFAKLSQLDDIKLNEGPTSEGTIKLIRAASISGRVVFGESGKPVAGVRVLAQGTGDGKYLSRAETMTDADGKYILRQLQPMMSTVALTLPPEILAQYNAAGRENVRLSPGYTTSDQDFSLVPGAVIRGKITSKETGQPLAGVGVTLLGPAHPDEIAQDYAKTGQDGTWLIHVPPGRQMAFFRLPAPLGMREPKPRGFDFTLADGQVGTADFQVPIDPTPPLKGQVVDPQGRPVAGVRILVQRDPNNVWTGGTPMATTDTDGRFLIRAVAPGNILRARKGRSSTIDSLTVGPNSKDAQVRLVLHPNPMSSIHVRVQQEDGRPIPKADVELEYGELNGNIAGEKRTTESGECTFPSLFPDMKYRVYVGAVGFGSSNIVVQVRSGAQTEIGPIRLARADAFVSGIVLDDETLMPVEKMQVYVHGRKSGGKVAFTGADGRFRIDGLVAEPLQIFTQKDGRDGPTQQIRAGEENLVLSPPRPTPAPK